jgi:hypothetical protein
MGRIDVTALGLVPAFHIAGQNADVGVTQACLFLFLDCQIGGGVIGIDAGDDFAHGVPLMPAGMGPGSGWEDGGDLIIPMREFVSRQRLPIASGRNSADRERQARRTVEFQNLGGAGP